MTFHIRKYAEIYSPGSGPHRHQLRTIDRSGPHKLRVVARRDNYTRQGLTKLTVEVIK